MRTMLGIVCGALALAACGQKDCTPPTIIPSLPTASPGGRFQIMPGGTTGEDVFLLDTTTGSLRRCWFDVKQKLTVVCGEPGPALT